MVLVLHKRCSVLFFLMDNEGARLVERFPTLLIHHFRNNELNSRVRQFAHQVLGHLVRQQQRGVAPCACKGSKRFQCGTLRANFAIIELAPACNARPAIGTGESVTTGFLDDPTDHGEKVGWPGRSSPSYRRNPRRQQNDS